MIVVKLYGGLGNQIWQYAFGLSQARRLKTELRLNTEVLLNTPQGWTKYNYELGCFKGVTEEIYNITSGLKLYKEGDSGEILNDTILDGYWQDENLFENVKDELRQKLQFKEKIEGNFKNTISIHIRRGDYLGGNHFVDLSQTDYYRKAIEYIKSKIKDPEFLIFSNDIEWTKNYLNFLNEKKHFINGNTINDLQLMSLCEHNITANSTYSWWSAWLNKNPNKIVIQPQKWLISCDIEKLKMNGSIVL